MKKKYIHMTIYVTLLYMTLFNFFFFLRLTCLFIQILYFSKKLLQDKELSLFNLGCWLVSQHTT